jgi:hypothetical protein
MWSWIRSSPCPTWRRGNDRGVALPGVLLLMAFLVGVSGWLVGHVRSDAALRIALDESSMATRVAEAAVEAVGMALGQQADWTFVDALAPALACPASPGVVVPVSEVMERLWVQAETNATSRWGADTPAWQAVWSCHAAGLLGRWPIPGVIPSVVVWVADDPEADGLPLRSLNQRLLVTAVARAGSRTLGEASATVTRVGPGAPVEVVAWRSAGGT